MLNIKQALDKKSAIMEPYDGGSLILCKDENSIPDIVSDADFKSINFYDDHDNCGDGGGSGGISGPSDTVDHSTEHSFLLMDANEQLHITKSESFCRKLRCTDNIKIKVVSIFGNTGDGKSHTMNHAFFNGLEVFKTSAEQNSCTLGVYAAMQPGLSALCLDTEGLLSTSSHNKKRMRMLLKILAISDIVIYRTRSERLHSDMYDFLGTASKAFCMHFSQALQSMGIPGSANLGPAVIIFHETKYTKPLESTVEESAEDRLRECFLRLNYDINAFSSLRYVGIQTNDGTLTDYNKLISALRMDLENTTVRSPRQPSVIFKAMRALNKKFSGEIIENTINPFPEQYFTCPEHCISCQRRCQRSMGHDNEEHWNTQPCQHQHQYDNKVDLCKACYNNGREVIVERIDGWTHAIINCSHCGELARNFKYWNNANDSLVIRTQTIHIWRDKNILPKGQSHSGQMVLDHVSYVCETLGNISSHSTGALKEWCADKVAPKYWQPNHEIYICSSCKKNFEKYGLRKHHCRGCGRGFCDACSRHQIPVPARNWYEPVRVCSNCYHQLLKHPDKIPDINISNNLNGRHNYDNSASGIATTTLMDNVQNDGSDVIARKCGETVYNTVTKVASVTLECAKEIIKDSARPKYWVPDADAAYCYICKAIFGTADELIVAHTNTRSPSLIIGNTTKKTMKHEHHHHYASNNTFKGGDCKRHHCRKCGQAVCSDCSKSRQPVPERGWFSEVRVCDNCVNDNVDDLVTQTTTTTTTATAQTTEATITISVNNINNNTIMSDGNPNTMSPSKYDDNISINNTNNNNNISDDDLKSKMD